MQILELIIILFESFDRWPPNPEFEVRRVNSCVFSYLTNYSYSVLVNQILKANNISIMILDVKHGFPQVRMNQHIFLSCLRISSFGDFTWSRGSRWYSHIKDPTEIASSPFTYNVCIVSRRANANRFRGATKQITHAECQIFEHVRDGMERRWNFSLGKDFVQHDIVVGGAGSTLESLVRLQEGVPVARLGDAAVDYGAA